MKRASRTLVFGVALLAVVVFAAAIAEAQGGGRGGGPRLSPEQLDAAWTLEAQGVSKDIGLNDGDTAKVVAAYKTSRTSHQKAMDDLTATGERGPGMFQQMQDIAIAERAKLAAELETAIGKEKADKAVAVLGTYGRGWDRLVDTLASFKLEPAKQSAGLTKIAEHIVEVDKAQQDAFASFDMEGLRAASQESKSRLDAAMADILSAEQLTVWNERTARGGGRGGPGGPGGPGGRGGPGEPGGPPPPPPPSN